jgi:anti-anti-sigma factor
MGLSKETIDGVVVIKASGDRTAATRGPLEQLIRAELSAGANRMVVDLSAVRYVASAGLRVFLIAAKAIGGKGRFVLAGAARRSSAPCRCSPPRDRRTLAA